MFQDEDFRKSVRRVAKVFKLCNMHMERVLAGIKTVSPGKHPNVERIMAAGYMSQLCNCNMFKKTIDERRSTTASDCALEAGEMR